MTLVPCRIKRRLLALAALLSVCAAIGTSAAETETSPAPDHPKISHSSVPDLAEFMGSWIWDKERHDQQTCRLWRAFDIPEDAKIIQARLLLTADNDFTVFLDGREIGRGAEWRELFSYNLSTLLSPGRHVLAIDVFNLAGSAGVLLGLRIELADGQRIEIKSDQDWKIVPEDAKGWKTMTRPLAAWPAATVVSLPGLSPWWTTPAAINDPSARVAIATRAEASPAPDRPRISHSSVPDLAEFMGSWIWDKEKYDQQTCRLWRAFDIPEDAKVVQARLLLTADNAFTVFLDGREIGHGAEWRELFDYNLSALLSPGRHVLAVEAFNPNRFAGLLLGLRIEFSNGRRIEIKSDQEWRVVPEQAKSWKDMTKPAANWPAAIVVAPAGSSPWWNTPDNINAMLTPPPLKIFFWQSPWFQIPFFIVCGLIAVTIFFLAAQIALHQKERWLLQRERARIAMDIHDDIGSRMTHLVLNGEVAQEELPANSKVRGQLENICDDARGVLASIDEILWALNPRRDTLQDFADYVCDYAQKFLGPANIECVFDVESETLNAIADLPLRRSLLMAIKETLNNTVKYSGATEFRLQIRRHRHNLSVIVQDNGRGFEPGSVRSGRHGLENISRRMQELGGSCRIVSEPGKGCRVELSIPLRSPRRLFFQRKQSPPQPQADKNPARPNADSESAKE